jgi:transcriptional regulator with XRE-family HTH domain
VGVVGGDEKAGSILVPTGPGCFARHPGMLLPVAELPLLAQFLRARREALAPADVGLRSSGRRRTPGLRREEVATLAGVSLDYLVRLEQGRDTNPSPSVLTALGDALRLTQPERHHLAGLVVQTNDPGFCPGGSIAEPEVPGTLRGVLDRLEPSPALVIGPYGDVLAWTESWGALAGPMGLLDGDPPNLAWFTFRSPQAREVFVDWEGAADDQASQLRGAALRWRDDERFIALVDQLGDEPEFATRWSSHQVAGKQRGTKQLRHPQLGSLQVDYEVLAVGDETGQRLLVWLPADAATEAAFDIAAGAARPVSPARLRVVGEA